MSGKRAHEVAHDLREALYVLKRENDELRRQIAQLQAQLFEQTKTKPRGFIEDRFNAVR